MRMLARAPYLDCVLTPQSLAEFFQAVTRKAIVPRAETTGQLRRWLDVFQIVPGPPPAGLLAAAAASTGRFQFYDALLLATAGAGGCTAVISEDMGDGAELDGVRVVAAFDAAGGIGPGALTLLGG